MTNKRSIQDIIPPARSKPVRASITTHSKKESESDNTDMKDVKQPPKLRAKNKRPSFGIFSVIIVILLIIGIVFGVVSTVFHRANVTIALKTYSIAVSESFTATPNDLLFPYTSRTLSEEGEKMVPRSGTEDVEKRATGTITIFNKFSSSSQRLIANTRFAAPDGRIYRIQDPVVVPGYTTSNGEVTPGTLDVVVRAEEPGEEYNKSNITFTIPGLKGTDQYEDMYAETKTALSGGFVGTQAIVSPEVRDAAIAELRSELDRTLRARFTEELGPDELFFPDTIDVTFIEQPDSTVDDGALVTLRAEATAPIFNQHNVAQAIADTGGVRYENPMRIENINELTILVKEEPESAAIELTVSGDVVLVGDYNKEQLLQDLAGQDRRNIGTVLSGYPAISDMTISVYPFWRGMLPQQEKNLKIEVVPEEEL
ncbi:MAG: hypothetical protein ACJKTH_02795 [Patescibacteria group bacterium UBA2163]